MNIKNTIVINTRIIVDIGVNKTRYLIRKYHTEPRSNVKKSIKCDEIFIGDVSKNDDASNPCVEDIPSFIRLGVE